MNPNRTFPDLNSMNKTGQGDDISSAIPEMEPSGTSQIHFSASLTTLLGLFLIGFLVFTYVDEK